MKKKYLIILLVVLVVIGFLFITANIFKNKNQSDEAEAIKIFEKLVSFGVEVSHSNDNNVNTIKEKLENLEYVKHVQLISKDDKFEDMKNELGESIIRDELSEMFLNSFIITIDINSIDDFEKIKSLENNIRQIDGINQVDSNCNELIEVYEKTGIKGMREYDKILTIMNEQGRDEVINYLDQHQKVRELLKDFIHF